jgi:hypothetical protein
MARDNKKAAVESSKHGRAWAPWFSWASPIGLGLYFLAVGGFLWMLSIAFDWSK